ncbi:hypothetical protein OH77DRAFT_1421804 [Trametes cingulata]|nr:hypothetical protein OH77DRAFT_1421804 [Trametes cingulata]
MRTTFIQYIITAGPILEVHTAEDDKPDARDYVSSWISQVQDELWVIFMRHTHEFDS